mgnify:CR=1 FL=1
MVRFWELCLLLRIVILLKLDLAKDGVVELDLLFAGGEPEIHSRMLKARIELPSSWDMLLRTNIVSYC